MPAPVVTPTGPLAMDGKQTQVFAATNSATSWTASGGTISGAGAASATWTAPNVTGTYTVKATNASGDSNIVTITVVAVLPNYMDWILPVEVDKKVAVFEPEDGPDQTRTYSGEREYFTIGNEDSSYDEGLEMKEFWSNHHPGKEFWVVDVVQDRRAKFKTDSKFTFAYNSAESWQWNAKIKQAWPFVWS